MAGGSFSAEEKKFSLLHRVQANSAVHPTSNPMGSGALSLGVGRQGIKLTLTSSGDIMK
jgi:hypothetical protein